MNAFKKLQAALGSYAGDTGPVTWSVGEVEGYGASLIATYTESLALEDEPWTQFGGDEILAAAGADRTDGGMDAADSDGDIQQWVHVKNDDGACDVTTGADE